MTLLTLTNKLEQWMRAIARSHLTVVSMGGLIVQQVA
jgi:hypothetical protein